MTARSWNPRAVALWTVFFLAVYVGVFWLPYRIHDPRALFSDASLHGSNNRIAILSMAVLLAAATLLRLVTAKPADLSPMPAAQKMPRWIFATVFGLHAALALFQAVLFRTGTSLFEPIYFLNRIYALKIGLKPYSDFEFIYGPLMLYPAVWLRHILHGNLIAAYSVLVGIHVLVGISLLWFLLQRARAGVRSRVGLFLAIAIIPPLGLGLQYTLARFLIAAASLLAIDLVGTRNRARWPYEVIAAVLLTLLVFSFSPEMGLAFVASLAAYWFVRYLRSWTLLYLLAAYAALMLCIAPLIPHEIFRTVLNFSKGGNTLPLIPAFYFIFYIAALLLTLSTVFSATLRFLASQRSQGVLPYTPALTAALGVLALAMMPGAMGRLDPGHVFLYGLPVFLLAFLLVWPSRALKIASGLLFVAIFTVRAGLYDNIVLAKHDYSVQLRSVLASRTDAHPHSLLARVLHHGNRQEDVKALRATQTDQWRPIVAQYAPLCAPVEGGYFTSQLIQSDLLQPDFFVDMISIYSPEQAQHKIQSLQGCRYVILPSTLADFHAGTTDSPANIDSEENRLRLYMHWPWIPPAVKDHAPPPSDIVLAYLQSQYVLVQTINSDYAIYRQRTAPF